MEYAGQCCTYCKRQGIFIDFIEKNIKSLLSVILLWLLYSHISVFVYIPKAYINTYTSLSSLTGLQAHVTNLGAKDDALFFFTRSDQEQLPHSPPQLCYVNSLTRILFRPFLRVCCKHSVMTEVTKVVIRLRRVNNLMVLQ